MGFNRQSWLQQLIERQIAAPDSNSSGRPPLPATTLARARVARRHLSARLADLGLLYGTPLAPAHLEAGRPPPERLLQGLMAGLVRLGDELADLMARPRARRGAELAAVFLALAGEVEDAEALAREPPSTRRLKSALEKAASRLVEKREVLTSDPIDGVPLHNGHTFVDAWTFGRLAIASFAEGRVDPRAAARRLAEAERSKAVLLEALVQLAWADGPPSASARKAIARQIGGLKLARDQACALKASIEHPSDAAALAARIRGREQRHFVVAQAVLASLVDGRRSSGEMAFLRGLAAAFELTRQELDALELQLAEFYAVHHEVVDTFTAGEAGLALADELVEKMARKVEKNLAAVVSEIKQTGELAELLAKAARGISLSGEERRRVRAQLIDVAKAIPSLAIFAAPGGFLLLAALAKVLPFQILPSAFHEQEPREK